MNSATREKTPWTKSREKPRPKKKEKGEHFDGVRRRLQNFPRIQWAIFVAGARGVRSLCFTGRRHDPVDSRFNEV